ncbi:hypothetical protein B0I72DRAFT_14565 [Yarrowia lipolytica]|jgi:hypothetical protein|uniref:YALI0E19030p n=2 Tax=Yarrowia lipolytica TaxID=4952 RepID=Q6C5D2_YARLI|nr:YALI0E19030p [Yarrowia lipolytica CLIB122]AOW05637.1 hypothetical protein YALI1_E22840g [Yarrowia lipolytica]KAB8281570.1 hypothetical protein BKA91DRAFT_31722 [Yarrowia lipolytica]KAE8171080.1 hypothetical protein BKA90DRAFT_31140 [Yarrowia lipolytica]KAJ8057106.1 hypothetical protein LXG23DRAFT_33986 [Yarrowia lipolytica]QNP99065.1 Hypothetical protein YALI2_E00381g [Yarrowia lipolytica]|eukprot:XP_504130.2 YALI0E19030p [Yarrowia lipolytica CLIB122]
MSLKSFFLRRKKPQFEEVAPRKLRGSFSMPNMRAVTILRGRGGAGSRDDLVDSREMPLSRSDQSDISSDYLSSSGDFGHHDFWSTLSEEEQRRMSKMYEDALSVVEYYSV